MKSEVTITINGQTVRASAGATILEAARQAEIYIPTLCYHPAIRPSGSCRLCAVEIGDFRGLPSACTTPVEDGMQVQTESATLLNFRREMLHLILQDHPRECLRCPCHGACELQYLIERIGIDESYRGVTVKERPIRPGGPFFLRDYNLCVRCVRICHEVRGAKAIVFREVDGRQEVGTPFDRPLEEVGCQFCGACVDSCPTGALRDSTEVERPEGELNCGGAAFPPLLPGLDSRSSWKYTICPYCGVGCRLACEVRDGKIISARPDARGPANRGQACVKGRFGIAEFVHGSERLTTPLIKNGNGLEPTSWENALSRVADALKRYKPEEVAVLASAKCTNEENYVIQKFARAVLKTNSVDHCARL
jgi:predicted molibdopterin-dependent oxidoreductase YjgC